MPRKKSPEVIFDSDIYWLSAKRAAHAAGLFVPELCRRANAGVIRFKSNDRGDPIYFAEPDIDCLRKERLAKERNKSSRKPREKSAAQLERQWAKQSAQMAKERGTSGMGPVALHIEKIMLTDIARKAKDPEK